MYLHSQKDTRHSPLEKGRNQKERPYIYDKGPRQK